MVDCGRLSILTRAAFVSQSSDDDSRKSQETPDDGKSRLSHVCKELAYTNPRGDGNSHRGDGSSHRGEPVFNVPIAAHNLGYSPLTHDGQLDSDSDNDDSDNGDDDDYVGEGDESSRTSEGDDSSRSVAGAGGATPATVYASTSKRTLPLRGNATRPMNVPKKRKGPTQAQIEQWKREVQVKLDSDEKKDSIMLSMAMSCRSSRKLTVWQRLVTPFFVATCAMDINPFQFVVNTSN